MNDGDIDPATAPAPTDSLAVEVLDDELAIYDEATGEVHHLNRPAATVWSLLDGSTTLADIGTAIAEASGAERNTVVADVVALARELGRAGLLIGVDLAAVEPRSP